MAVFAFQQIYAQEDTLLTHYRKKALMYQQSVKIAQEQLHGAESQAESVKSSRLPSLDFNSKYNYYGQPLQLAPTNGATIGEETHNFYNLSLDLYQPILTGGELKNTKKAAESEVEIKKSMLVMSKQQVVYNSDLLFWNAVSRKEINNLYTKYKESISEFLKVIQDKVDEEVVGKNELYQAKVRYDDAEYSCIRSKKEFDVSIMNINKFIGQDLYVPALVPDSLTVVEWIKTNESLANIALDQRPEMQMMKDQVLKYQYTEKVSGSKFKPQMGVLASGRWGSPSPGLQLEPDFNYVIKAFLTIPIFHWGQKKEEQFVARKRTEVSKLQMEETVDRITLEVNSSYYMLEKSQEQLDYASSSMQNATMNVSVMLDRYNEGLSSVLEVLDSELYWQKSYYNYILAKYEVNVAYSKYQYSIGELSKIDINQE
jgi:outer membrane protein TolC